MNSRYLLHAKGWSWYQGTLFLHPFLMVRADPASEHEAEAAQGHKGPDEALRERTGFR